MTSATPDVVLVDTSCLIALNVLDDLDALRAFYDAVAIPPAVAHEYREALPGWIDSQRSACVQGPESCSSARASR